MNKKNINIQANKIKVLFFCRVNCDASFKAQNHLVNLGFEVTTIFSKGYGDTISDNVESWSGDYIICFRSMLILSKKLINKASIAAINFHPGPPEYPGSGCVNFALYEQSKIYGVTAHIMTEKVDDGKIVDCIRFPIFETDSVHSLLERTHIKLLNLFYDVTTYISIQGNNYIDESVEKFKNEKWSGIKRKMKDLDNLSIIDINVREDELIKLIRATYIENYPPKVILYGFEFTLKSDKKIN